MRADPTPEGETSAMAPLLRLEGVTVHFPVRSGGLLAQRKQVHAVDDVDLAVLPGETLGLVGESGSGKTTLGYTVLGHYRPTAGRVFFEGEDVTGYQGRRLRELRRHMQMIFQDPYSSLNPRMRVEDIVGEPLVVHRVIKDRRALRERVATLLELCGMPGDVMNRYPHAFSGGQRQRIVIARALALEPKLIVADEPTSALDVSVQAQVINLLQDLQRELGLTYLFISHNLSVVRHISTRIAIMYLGRIFEVATATQIFEHPRHPYTQALLSAIPVPDPDADWHSRRIHLKGEVPSPIDPPRGCRFNTRCPIAVEQCFHETPPLDEKAPGHRAACWLAEPDEVSAVAASADVGGPPTPAGSAPAPGVEMYKPPT